MSTIFDRCIVRFEMPEGKHIDIFMYGATTDDLRGEDGFWRIKRAAQRLGIDADAIFYSLHPVIHELPRRTTRVVYSRGRQAAEFV